MTFVENHCEIKKIDNFLFAYSGNPDKPIISSNPGKPSNPGNQRILNKILGKVYCNFWKVKKHQAV